MANITLQGAGLGLRRSMLSEIDQDVLAQLDFMEVAPENWIRVGGKLGKQFDAIAAAIPMCFHGLSLSLGGPTAIDVELVKSVKQLMARCQSTFYSEHLSYCSDDGHLYDLMPIPFTQQAVTYVAERIMQVQDILQQRIAIENVSYYAALSNEMSELDFINAVIQQADCDLLLDVNNIYVNSINHGYDASAFLSQLPGERVTYIHVAGHFDEAEDLKVDTHGSDVIPSVWNLLAQAFQLFGEKPTLLERDFNIPPLQTLLKEVQQIKAIQLHCRQGAL